MTIIPDEAIGSVHFRSSHARRDAEGAVAVAGKREGGHPAATASDKPLCSSKALLTSVTKAEYVLLQWKSVAERGGHINSQGRSRPKLDETLSTGLCKGTVFNWTFLGTAQGAMRASRLVWTLIGLANIGMHLPGPSRASWQWSVEISWPVPTGLS